MPKQTVPLIVAIAIPGLAWSGASAALVDVDLAPADQTVCVGDIVEIDIVLASDGAAGQPFDAVDVVFSWDPSVLTLIGNDDSGASTSWFLSGFLPDPDDVNEDLLDGDAIYTALAPPAVDPIAPPAPGSFTVTTLQFMAIAETALTDVEILATIGVFGASQVALDGMAVTGTLGGPAGVTEVQSRPGDCAVPCDGSVDVVDLLALLAEWGMTGTPCDIAGADTVDVVDLLALLAAWGPCP